ncbi:MAG: 16S rRNA methyltransferase [Treponema sp.]|nr:16S rRNA methyltransferase [Treponema sp.]
MSGKPGPALKGGAAFDSYYRDLYGSRWAPLREALMFPAGTVAYEEGLIKPYHLDRASVLAAKTLRLPELGLILDACAAPGGKTLVLASQLAKGATILANELSSERRRRLVDVLDEHLSVESRKKITVSGFDLGKAGGKRTELSRFSSILLDAPCSAEAHVIKSFQALAEWTPSRPKNLAVRQWALLSSAFLLLKSGGSLVYATCSLDPMENDGVVSRLIEKYQGEAILDKPDFEEGEKTAFGRMILPDSVGGMGPMYVARIHKKGLPL